VNDKDLKAEIQKVFEWADQEQADGALIQHHGINRKWDDRWGLGFTGYVLIFSSSASWTMEAGWKNLITQKEHDRLIKIAGVKEFWNGVGLDSMSFRVNRMGKGIGALVGTYRKGCPHKGPLTKKQAAEAKRSAFSHTKTGQHESGSVFCRCGWFRDGYEKAVFPKGWS
jgi:hypothetical protein